MTSTVTVERLASEVAIVIETEMSNDPKYSQPAMKLVDAKALVLAGAVSPQPDGTYTIAGSKEQPYLWKPDVGCACPQATQRHVFCKHATAVHLFQLVQRRLGPTQPALLPVPPQTVDARLAQAPVAPDLWQQEEATPDLWQQEEELEVIVLPDTLPGEDTGTQGRGDTATGADADGPPRVPVSGVVPASPSNQAALDGLATHDVPGLAPGPFPGVEDGPTASDPRRSISAIIADLSQPLPKACFATKTVKGSVITFIHWQTAVRVLDTYAPGWQGEIREVAHLAGHVMIIYRLSIPCREGVVWREATGCEEEALKGYGDTFSNAEAMAFKRAAAKFGVALDLYDKDDTAAALAQHLAQGEPEDPPPPAPLDTATARKRIAALLLAQGHAPKSKTDYEQLVLMLTGLPLVPDHFGEIVRRLEYYQPAKGVA
jgi:hypothetical protein